MNYYMAPMEGVTTDVYRRAYHKNFASFDKYFTPFIVPYEKPRFAIREIREIAPERNPGMNTVPQILTNDADGFLETVRKLKEYGYQEVNLNLGCPSKTVVNKGRGSGFLAEPEKLEHFLDQIFTRTDIKISLKTRIGKDDRTEFFRLFAIYEKFPLEELIIHPRIQTDYYQNLPDLEMYEYAEKNTNIRLCYNGDVNNFKDDAKIRECFPKTESIMLGRGVIRNPFLLKEIQGIRKGGSLDAIELKRMGQFHQDLVEGYLEICGTEKNVLYKMKEIWRSMEELFMDKPDHLMKIKKSGELNEMLDAAEFIFS